MSTSREQAISALKTLVAGVGMSLTEDDLDILERNEEEADKHKDRLLKISKAIYYGFFNCAAEGIVLVPESRIVDEFGHSLEDNYPEANEVFLKFAKTYWTLRVLEFSLIKNEREWIPTYLLVNLDQTIGPLFFPFPGPAKIAPSRREKDQRELLQKSGANIDIEEFMRGNPILIRDRKSSAQGVGAAAVEAAEISKQLESFCSDCITALGIALDIAIKDRHEYEAGFNKAMDMLSEVRIPCEVPKGVPKKDRPRILAEIKRYAEIAGIPYNKLSPLNQLIVTIPPYVFYCLEKYLPNDLGLREEARHLMNTRGFPRYLQENLGYPISQKIKGAFWIPKPLGFLSRLFGFGRRH